MAPSLKFIQTFANGFYNFVVGQIFGHLISLGALQILFFSLPLIISKMIDVVEKVDLVNLNSKCEPLWNKIIQTILLICGFATSIVIKIPQIVWLSMIAIVAGGLFYAIISQIFTIIKVNINYMILGELVYVLLVGIALFL